MKNYDRQFKACLSRRSVSSGLYPIELGSARPDWRPSHGVARTVRAAGELRPAHRCGRGAGRGWVRRRAVHPLL